MFSEEHEIPTLTCASAVPLLSSGPGGAVPLTSVVPGTRLDVVRHADDLVEVALPGGWLRAFEGRALVVARAPDCVDGTRVGR